MIQTILYAVAWSIAAWFPITDADIWWHLASAKEMLAQGNWLHADPFTFSSGGAWVNVHWLYQLIIYGVYNCCGATGLVAFHSLCWGGAAYLWVRRPANSKWLLLSLPLLWACHYLLMARPLALTMLLLAMQFRVFYAAWPGRVRWAMLLFLQLLLANSQGLFLLGPILVACYAWEDRRAAKEQIWGPVGLVAMSCVHPDGPGILLYPWRLFARLQPGNLFGAKVAENVSPASALLHYGYSMAFFQAAALIVVSLLAVLLFFRKGVAHRNILLLVPFLGLAWVAQRNIPILFLIAIPILFNSTSEGRTAHRWGWIGIAFGFALLVAQLQWWMIAPSPVAPFRTPEGASAYLLGTIPQNATTRVFCEIRHGGFLAWKLHPQVSTFVDGRLILRDSAFFARYLDLETHPEGFTGLKGYSTFDYAVIPVGYPQMLHPLAVYLSRNPDWKLVYFDEVAWVFARTHLAAIDLGSSSRVDEVRDSAYRDFSSRSSTWHPLVRVEGEYWWRSASSLLHSSH